MLKYVAIALLVLLVGCSQSMYTQGKKLVDQGEYKRAIDKNADAWREMGVAFYEQGDLVKAEDALKQANAIRPDARTNLYMGLVYEKQEMYGKAIDAYRASLSLNPGGKTKNMIRSHLDALISKKVKQEVSLALANETAIDIDTSISTTPICLRKWPRSARDWPNSRPWIWPRSNRSRWSTV